MTVEQYIAEFMPKMGGWCTPEKASRIAGAVGKSYIFVEIGVFAGRSLFAAALSMTGVCVAIGIDPWKREDSVKGFDDANKEWWGNLNHDQIYDECRRDMEKLELSSKCYLLRCNSAEAFPLIKFLPPVDVLHIDGNHSETESCFDVVKYVPLVRDGGTIFFDDLGWATTKRAQGILCSMADPLEPVGDCGVFRKKP